MVGRPKGSVNTVKDPSTVYAIGESETYEMAYDSFRKIHPDWTPAAVARKVTSLWHNRNRYREIAARLRAEEAEKLHTIQLKTAAMKKTTLATGNGKVAGEMEELLTKILNQLLVMEQIMKEQNALLAKLVPQDQPATAPRVPLQDTLFQPKRNAPVGNPIFVDCNPLRNEGRS